MIPSSTTNESAIQVLIGQLGDLPQWSIGRRPDNTLVLESPKVSGHHAQLTVCSPTSYLLEDLNSKNGTYVNEYRCVRKIIDLNDLVRFGDLSMTVKELVQYKSKKNELLSDKSRSKPGEPINLVEQPPVQATKNVLQVANSLDFSREFAGLKSVYEQYPQLRKSCRDRDKLIRTGSVIISSIVGVSAVLSTGGGALPLMHILSGAGLGILIPTLSSTLLSTDEKLEVIDKEYRERYRCPNPACRDPFLNREWSMLAQQKTCRRCKAIWTVAE